MSFQEMLKTVLETEAEGEKQFVETLKSADTDEKTVEAAVAHYRMQHGFKDMVSKDVFAEVAKANGYELAKAKAKEDEGDPKKPFPGAAAPFGGKKKEETKKSVVEGLAPEVQALFKAQDSELEELRKADKAKDERIEAIEKEAIRKELVTKCQKDYSHVPGMSSEELADVIQKGYGVSEDYGKALEKQFAKTNEAVKKSALITAQGVLATNGDSTGAWARMESMAKSMESDTEGLSFEQALSRVMDENPELYEEYLEENPKQG